MDNMAMTAELDDLGNLFEFGDLDLAVDSAQYGAHLQQHPHQHQQQSAGTHPNTPFDEMNEAQAMQASSAQDFDQYEQARKQLQYRGLPQTSHPYTSEPMYQPSMQQSYHPGQQYAFPGMQGFPPSQHVPLTPNSFGMHGETAPFMQQQQMDPQQRAILEQRYQLRKEDAVSPCGSPDISNYR